MKGQELSRGYYESYGRPMLEEQFPELLPYLAVGFVGSGSERYGFDDEVSRDHDFEPGFCIFLPGEDTVDRRSVFRLERAYAKLPKEYEGVSRQPMSPVGGNRNGVLRTAEFYEAAVGSATGELSADAWLRLPEYALAEATNGVVYADPYGEFSRIRERLSHFPEDIRLKRLAGNLLLMAQSGQYNYLRCLSHGEPEAAALCLREFVTASLKAVFLLRDAYLPYYKWSFRALRALPDGEKYAALLGGLLGADLSGSADPRAKYERIEEVCGLLIGELTEAGLTKAVCGDLEKHAYSVNDHIGDSQLRNRHILAGV